MTGARVPLGNLGKAALDAERGRGMPATEFGTIPVPGFGIGAEIAGAAPYRRRVVLQPFNGGGTVFVSDQPNISSATAPRAFPLPVAGSVVVLVIGEDQGLYCVTTGGMLLAYAVSGPVPTSYDRRHQKPGLSSFGQIAILGGAGAPVVEIVGPDPAPRRVAVNLGGGGVVLLSPSSQFANAPGSIKGYQLIAGLQTVFVLAPNQGLYSRRRADFGGGTISVHASRIVLAEPRGPTGIPGPDGQE